MLVDASREKVVSRYAVIVKRKEKRFLDYSEEKKIMAQKRKCTSDVSKSKITNQVT